MRRFGELTANAAAGAVVTTLSPVAPSTIVITVPAGVIEPGAEYGSPSGVAELFTQR